MEDQEVFENHVKILEEMATGQTNFDHEAVKLSLHATSKARVKMVREKRTIEEILTIFPILRRDGMVSCGRSIVVSNMIWLYNLS